MREIDKIQKKCSSQEICVSLKELLTKDNQASPTLKLSLVKSDIEKRITIRTTVTARQVTKNCRKCDVCHISASRSVFLTCAASVKLLFGASCATSILLPTNTKISKFEEFFKKGSNQKRPKLFWSSIIND